MSGIARIMIARGVKVSGSDAAASDLLTALAAQGADVHVGHAAENLDGADTLVVSTAIRADNPELAEARRRGLRVLHRAAALASRDAGPARGRGGGHPRQDHHHRHAHHDPAAQRRRPRVRDRRDPHRNRAGRRRRQRGDVRRRGRRERRLVPDARARTGDRHQRRGRPPRQLRRPGRDRGGVRGVRPADRPRRGADRLRRRPGRRALAAAGGRGAGPQLRREPGRRLPAHRRAPARHVRAFQRGVQAPGRRPARRHRPCSRSASPAVTTR